MAMETIKETIENAKNLDEINALRMEVVKSKNDSILKLWQDKYWSMKNCPTCGKERGIK